MRPIQILCAGGRALVKNQTKKTTVKRTTTNKISVNFKDTSHDHPIPIATPSFQIAPPTYLHIGPEEPDGGAQQDEAPLSSSESNDFSGRVHSESYSAHNLSAAFDLILSSSSSPSSKLYGANEKATLSDDRTPTAGENPTQTFISAVKNSTLSTLETYRQSILESLAKDDPSGRIYSKNVRQMKDILAYERWRKKIEKTINLSTVPSDHVAHDHDPRMERQRKDTNDQVSMDPSIINPRADDFLSSPEKFIQSSLSHPTSSSKPVFSTRKELDERPTISDPTIVQKLLKEFWKLDELLVDGTVLVSYAGYPTLIDELLRLKNVKRVIAIEEKPEYCTMYTHRWKEEVENNRLFHIKNDGYWWESYSEIEEEGLLDDVPIEPWEKVHPSLFFICQLPHNKRSIQFIMQLISFIPNRNWLFQYGRVGLGFIGSGDLCQRLTREQTEKKYTRITAAANCLTNIQTPIPGMIESLTMDKFFPSNLSFHGSISSSSSSSSSLKSSSSKSVGNKKKTKKIYKSSPESYPTPFASSLFLAAKPNLTLTSDEFDCLNFLQRIMFIHSAQSWVESISHAAAGASIMYDKLKEMDKVQNLKIEDELTQDNAKVEELKRPKYYIPKSKTPRSFSDLDWINLAKTFNKWPFRPKSFENDLELDLDDGSGT